MERFYMIAFLFSPIAYSSDNKPKISSFTNAKKYMLESIYTDHRQTLYCNASFDSEKRVFFMETPQKLNWEHVVPAENFGRALKVWNKGIPECKKKGLSNRACARKTSPIFKQMEADMHNIFPAIRKINKKRNYFNFTDARDDAKDGEPILSGCDIKISGQKIIPPAYAKGRIARAYLYMEETYKNHNYKMSATQKKLMQAWHKIYPVSEWECIRDARIAKLQGNHNPFVYEKCSSKKFIDIKQ